MRDRVEGVAKGESSLPVKDQPSVSRSASDRLASGGVGVRGRSSSRVGLGSSTSRSGQAESGPAFFVYRGAPLWCISVYLMGVKERSYKK
jgi:hypothetical protein